MVVQRACLSMFDDVRSLFASGIIFAICGLLLLRFSTIFRSGKKN